MTSLEKHHIPAITESGVRRRARSLYDWLWDKFIPPMAARQNKEADKSLMTWRGAQTGFFLALTTMVGVMTNKMMSGPDNNQIQHSIDRLGDRMTVVESKVEGMDHRVNALQASVDGALRGMRL